MRKIIVQLCLACTILLPFQTLAQQANQTHKTAQTKRRMFKTNMDVARLMDETMTTLRKVHEEHAPTGLPNDFHYRMKDWTQQDVTNFAKCPETFDFFETLLGMANAAAKTDASGGFTADAVEAQSALTYLKPNNCKSWKSFYNMIANASDETEVLRARFHKSMGTQKKRSSH